MQEQVFSVEIDSRNVDAYISFKSLEEITLQTESESIWDFYTDIVNIELDKSCLFLFKADEFSVGDLKKKLVKIYYYKKNILTGCVLDAAYDFNDETVKLEIASAGKIVSDLELESFESLSPDNPINSFLILSI